MRHWLEANKIWFETVAALALTVMSLVVSYGSLTVSRHQLELSEAQVAPVLRIEGGVYFTGDAFGPPTEKDRRYAAGFVRLLNDSTNSILTTELLTESVLNLSDENGLVVWLPLKDETEAEFRYADVAGHERARTGEIVEFRQRQIFFEGYGPLLDRMAGACRSGTELACQFRKNAAPVVLARFRYTDRLGRETTRYFELFGSIRKRGLAQTQLASLFEGAHKSKEHLLLKQLAGDAFGRLANKVQRTP